MLLFFYIFGRHILYGKIQEKNFMSNLGLWIWIKSKINDPNNRAFFVLWQFEAIELQPLRFYRNQFSKYWGGDWLDSWNDIQIGSCVLNVPNLFLIRYEAQVIFGAKRNLENHSVSVFYSICFWCETKKILQTLKVKVYSWSNKNYSYISRPAIFEPVLFLVFSRKQFLIITISNKNSILSIVTTC